MTVTAIIYVAGHRCMVGSAIVRQLLKQGHAPADIITRTVGQVVGYQGEIDFDASKPDGAPRKLMDSSRLNALGWQAQVKLANGLALAYADFLSQRAR